MLRVIPPGLTVQSPLFVDLFGAENEPRQHFPPWSYFVDLVVEIDNLPVFLDQDLHVDNSAKDFRIDSKKES
jgi:hypothetical protein